MNDKNSFINLVARLRDDGTFCENWAGHFGVTIDVQDCGTHEQVFFGSSGEKSGPFHADEGTMQKFHAELRHSWRGGRNRWGTQPTSRPT